MPAAARPATSDRSRPESGGFQAALDRGLHAEVREPKSTGVLPSSKRQVDPGTAASGAGKTGKERERELAAVGLALPALLDPLTTLPVTQLLASPQQSSLAQGSPAEGTTTGPGAGSSGAQSSENGKVAQELALAAAQISLLPSGVSTQSGIANQNSRGPAPLPDASPSSEQAVSSAASASTPSAFPSGALSTPVLPVPILPTTPASPSSSVQPIAAKSGSKQGLAVDAAGVPASAASSGTSVNVSPSLSVPNLLSQNQTVPNVLAPQAAAAPASKLTGTSLNANRVSQPADGKQKQTGSASGPTSSAPSEIRSASGHTFGAAPAVEPSAPVIADASGPNSTSILNGTSTDVAGLSTAVAGSNGHAAADGSGSQALDSQLAASAASSASQAATAAAPSINTAKVLETIHGTELRLGLHSTEFGSISIATSVSSAGITAQIALDHGALGKALATHLTSMEEKLGSSFGLPAKVELHGGTMSGSQGSGAGTAGSGEDSRGDARQRWAGSGAELSPRVGKAFSGSVSVAESRAGASSSARLSVQA